ncbi:MAG: ribosomal protein S18 acetylase RimI-like enzyme [Glaciecola sp.]
MRGVKVGEKLLHHVVSEVMEMNVKVLFLLTNAKCEAAIHLYQKNGFVHSKSIMQSYGKSYARCDVAMQYIATTT